MIGSSIERDELDRFVVRNGETIARRGHFRLESAEDLTEEYYMVACLNATHLAIEPAYADFAESTRNKTFGKVAAAYSARPLVNVRLCSIQVAQTWQSIPILD